ncbi:probable phosphomannomutase isoform X2 [Zootermopsis nevadensis]|uniref:probable phosphomannomutase isoform X2 n=1 Tax=Zootermopsis nevadensis TaxID=136037 RepID=UPI000B8E8AB0|nr:probable phosphomannomutase isoform X2 [Zootermopsis nevadensis]
MYYGSKNFYYEHRRSPVSVNYCTAAVKNIFESRNMLQRENIMCLFDVDGTLTAPMKVIEPDIESFLFNELKPKYTLGLIGGSDFKKIAYQMGGSEEVLKKYDYVFAENGLIAYKDGKSIGCQSIQEHMGEETLQTFINFALGYMSQLKLPVKRGTFIEFRTGLINVCPVGRSCSQVEREQFFEYDKEHKIRENFVKALEEKFSDLGLVYSIGGQISFDVFPKGWDKTYCLQYLEKEMFEEIHFFGDKTDPGGNDYQIFTDPRTIGHKVTSPADTVNQLKQLLK